MELKKLTDKIYYYPHQPALDRPMLAYLKGGKFSLAIDAGYSEAHVRDFYRQLSRYKLKNPDLTVITHWHYDHTLGMRHIHGLSAALERTNAHLDGQRRLMAEPGCIDRLKQEDAFSKRSTPNSRIH